MTPHLTDNGALISGSPLQRNFGMREQQTTARLAMYT